MRLCGGQDPLSLSLQCRFAVCPRWGIARARNANQSHQHRIPGQQMLIMTIGLLPDAMEPEIHCVRTHWIPGFIAFLLVRRICPVRLMVPV